MSDLIALSPLLRAAEERLTVLGVAEARLDLLYLAERAFAIPISRLRRADGVQVPADAVATFQALVDRRAAREPVQRILGDWEFWGLTLALGPETLIPRPDTETLVEAVLKRRPDRHHPWHILDLGTGTGAILLALLSEYRQAFGVGVDLSPDAVAVACGNARSLGLRDRASFLAGSWVDAVASRFDIIVSNPPYIPDADIAGLAPEVARFEPWRALAGGADGLDPYRHLVRVLPPLLKQHGIVGFEHGADQGPAVADLMRAAGLAEVATICDLGGRDRVTLGQASAGSRAG
ncbi:MAG: peptide chain release factor N(5)-glutamine methyltransferase [Niveispirillum sp.]|uniref:peptide chain release factor N(5)-glutamine methyltransferase n=1 Tax=Niveispirillum sp. TaxID=1917217 RepID=UPI003BA463AB